MSENKQYENEYKVQAVKLAKKIGAVKAANKLQIHVYTLVKTGSEYRRRKPAAEKVDQSIGKRKQTPKSLCS